MLGAQLCAWKAPYEYEISTDSGVIKSGAGEANDDEEPKLQFRPTPRTPLRGVELICIGINDVWRQFDNPAIPDGQVMPEEYEANVEAMILSVKDQVKGIFLMTPIGANIIAKEFLNHCDFDYNHLPD